MYKYLLLAALIALSACEGVDKIGIPAPPPNVEKPRKLSIHWFEILGETKGLGFVGKEVSGFEGRSYPVFYVYDIHHRKRGYYLEGGRTVRHDITGDKELGKMDPAKSVRQIFKLAENTPIRIVSMDQG